VVSTRRHTLASSGDWVQSNTFMAQLTPPPACSFRFGGCTFRYQMCELSTFWGRERVRQQCAPFASEM